MMFLYKLYPNAYNLKSNGKRQVCVQNRKRFELSHPILDSKKDALRNDYFFV